MWFWTACLAAILMASIIVFGEIWDRLCCVIRKARAVNCNSWQDASQAWTALSRAHGSVFERNCTDHVRELWVLHKQVYRRQDKSAQNKPAAPDTTEKKAAQVEGCRVIVFLVHGGGGRAENWHSLIQGFEKLLTEEDAMVCEVSVAGATPRLNCLEFVALELLGHGRSAKPVLPDAYRLSHHIHDLEELMKKHIPQARQRAQAAGEGRLAVMLVGHSVGSAIVIQVAARQGVPVDHLVLLGTGSHQELANGVWHLPACLLERSRWLFALASRGLFYHPTAPADHVALEARMADQNPLFVMKYLLQHIGSEWPCAATLSRLAVPTVVLQGASDQIFKKGTEFARNIPNCKVHVLEEAGHNFITNQGDRVAQLLWPDLHLAAARAAPLHTSHLN